jgi:hypothetical protein
VNAGPVRSFRAGCDRTLHARAQSGPLPLAEPRRWWSTEAIGSAYRIPTSIRGSRFSFCLISSDWRSGVGETCARPHATPELGAEPEVHRFISAPGAVWVGWQSVAATPDGSGRRPSLHSNCRCVPVESGALHHRNTALLLRWLQRDSYIILPAIELIESQLNGGVTSLCRKILEGCSLHC